MRFQFALLLFFSASLLSGVSVAASSFQRSLEMELEAIEDASAYEIELKSQQSGKVLKFKMKEPYWRAKVRPGAYDFRLRAYDLRGVPGEWSESEKFVVNFPPPTQLTPAAGAEIKSSEIETAEVKFNWGSAPGAAKYKVFVENTKDGTKVFQAETDKTEVSLVLPVAENYKWSVIAVLATGDEGEKTSDPAQFSLLGAKIEKVEIEKPFDKYVQTVTWSKPEFSDRYDYILQKREGTSWKTIEKKSDLNETRMDFSNEHPGGRYRLAVRARSPGREPSDLAMTEFSVHEGDRSPAAIQVSRLRESMDKPTSWYGVASYLITNIDYSGVDADQNKKIDYSATGGTGRIGVGYFDPKRDDGFIGILDMSGINVSGENIQFASLELHYAKKLYLATNKVLLSAGLFSKELPESRQRANGAYYHDLVSYSGPHAGVTFWHPFTPKLGVQVNARFYYSLFTDTTPNGNDIESELTTQFGVMGSLRLSERLTGFAGLASRVDRASYKKSSSANTQFSNQEIQLKGNYLNLLLEYGF